MVTLGVNAGGVIVGTLGDGAGQSVWSAPSGASCGVFGVTAFEGSHSHADTFHFSFSLSDGGNHSGVGYLAPLRDS